MIIFLNMLIAIMADTFSKVTQDAEKYKRKTALDVMSDYIKLIDSDSLSRRNMTMKQKYESFKEYFLMSNKTSPCSNLTGKKENRKESNSLVVV